MNLSSYIKIQKTLLATFCVSVVVMVLSVFPLFSDSRSANANTSANNVFPTPTVTPVNVPVNNTPNSSVNSNSNAPTDNSSYSLIVIGTISFLTSLTSLLGFISTTVLAWRKEKRDVHAIRLENEKKELELIKLKIELEKIKAEEKPAKRKSPKRSARDPKNSE